MKIFIQTKIKTKRLDVNERALLKSCAVSMAGMYIIEQKCDLPEKEAWQLLELIQGCGYIVDLKMLSIGRFYLVCFKE